MLEIKTMDKGGNCAPSKEKKQNKWWIYFSHGFIEIQEPYQEISRKLIFPEIEELINNNIKNY